MSSLDFDLDTQTRVTPLADADPAAELLQRRWFAAAAAAKSLEAECEVLLEVLEISRQAWRAARAQLARLEALSGCAGRAVGRVWSSTAPPARRHRCAGYRCPSATRGDVGGVAKRRSTLSLRAAILAER